ncbi:MAG: large repetitive protein [Solirubrobacterales bacterium]|jgi:hypothetical protein|nr:large repetitive protein [Solirubrobacterales bacterium]
MHQASGLRSPGILRRGAGVFALTAIVLVPTVASAQDFVPAPTSPEPGGSSPGGFVTADFNNDGKADLAFTDGSNAVRITLGNGAGDFTEPPTSPEPLPSTANAVSPAPMATGNFNGDANLDLVVSETPSAFTILLGVGGGDFAQAPTSPKPGPLFPAPAVGSFNGDALQDIALEGSHEIYIELATGAGDFAKTAQSPSTNCDSSDIVVGDFNEDAHDDVAVTDNEDCGALNNSGITRYLGNGTGSFTYGGRLIVQSITDLAGQIFVADVNRDAHQDLLVATTGSTYVLLGNGANVFSPAPSSPESGLAEAVADFSGDGNPDFVTTDFSGPISIVPGSATGDFGAPGTPQAAGSGPSSVGYGDFDNDTDLDLALGKRDTDNIVILLNQVQSGPPGTNPPPGTTPADAVPPQTTITKAPKKKLLKSTAKLEFASNEAGSSFECQLKGKRAKKKLKKFRACSSPIKYKKLKPGNYKFAVRATDLAGNVDSSPAKAKFKRQDGGK